MHDTQADSCLIVGGKPLLAKTIEIIGVKGLPIIKAGDNLARLICDAAERQGTPIKNRDIIVVTHVVVSRAEGNVVNLDEIVPSNFAETIAKRHDKDAALIEVVLRESYAIKRMRDGKLITESKHGIVCANAGVDKSNVPGEKTVALLPEDPDNSARKIKEEIGRLSGCEVAVIISDTHGRPLREGEMNVAIGVAGITPLRDRRGEKDLFGYVLRVKQTAIADELASAAELEMGQADEGIPATIIRGYTYARSETARAADLMRPEKKDLFL